MIPTMEQAEALLRQYNSEPFHLKHAEIVSGVMRYFANELATATRPSIGRSSACCTIWTSSAGRSSTASKVRS